MSGVKKGTEAGPEIPTRFTVPQRVEHFFLAVSFTALGLTGLVQKFGLNPFSESLINLMGGIEMTRVIHRAAAIVFALLGVYHCIAVGHKLFVRRVRMTMLPVPKDAADAVCWLAYSLFLRKAPPRMPRYTFAEKLEYWALIWGGIIMIGTGFMLWNPLITTRFLPGQFIPAAKAAHGGEAVLAVLAIIVWHFYNVHIKMFNRSMFTGRLTPHQMEEEHEAEWSEIAAGGRDSLQPRLASRYRQGIFIMAAIPFAALGIGGIYWAATAETTAISTLPAPLSKTEIYSPTITPPHERAGVEGISAPAIPHPVAGQEQCNACHGASGFKPVPSNHTGRPVESCRICHRPGPAAVPKAASVGTPATRKKSSLNAVPHATAGPYKNCLICHGLGKMKPFPEHHASAKVENCLICHK
jgi:cytochrome b subunit of formate dehydrogenase